MGTEMIRGHACLRVCSKGRNVSLAIMCPSMEIGEDNGDTRDEVRIREVYGRSFRGGGAKDIYIRISCVGMCEVCDGGRCRGGDP